MFGKFFRACNVTQKMKRPVGLGFNVSGRKNVSRSDGQAANEKKGGGFLRRPNFTTSTRGPAQARKSLIA
jgi:hypothetical protein